MLTGPTVRYRLRRRPAAAGGWAPTAEQSVVIDHWSGRLRVLAGPGTGKTATIVEAVADRIDRRGVDPGSLLVLTFSRRAAGELADRLTRRIGVVTREPMVRTFHSYAWALLRSRAAAAGQAPPRLLGAGESDRMVRELLAGHAETGGDGWPAALRPALSSPAFAAEVRDLMMRAAERGIGPADLRAAGRAARRPEWVAVGRFAMEYQQVADLRQGSTGLGPALDQAELTRAALAHLADDRILAAEQARVRHLFVDEYQDVDPAQAELVEVLGAGAQELVVVGDPDQAIYGFRGSDRSALAMFTADATVGLTVSRRSSPPLLAATRRVASLLPAVPAAPSHRELTVPSGFDSVAGTPQPEVEPEGADVALDVRVLPSAAREAAYVADQLRRAHLLQGIPWSRMAVVLRSPARSLAALRRACAVAGVPMSTAALDRTQIADPVASALVGLLECGIDPTSITGERAMQLLGSPFGGLDALAQRALRRAVRAARPDAGSGADQVAAMLLGSPPPDGLPPELLRPLRRVTDLLALAADGAGAPAAEDVLWDLWAAGGLAESLTTTSERGGVAGQRADAALDAVVALFADAADLAARLPRAGVPAFVAQARATVLPAAPDRLTRSVDAVTVLSAHAAKGLEWDLVAVAGVQEGTWPDLRPRGGLLGVDVLLDRLGPGGPAGVGGPSGTDASTAPVAGGRSHRHRDLLLDERRLFYVACTRARRRLVVTAVQGQDEVPSRFLGELAGGDDEIQGWPREGTRDRRALHLADLVAELRRAATGADGRRAQAAAAQLARLAAAGVAGAHPDQWYGLADVSTSAAAVPPGAEVAVSPSAVDAVATCALRAVLERRGARKPAAEAQTLGIVVHAAANGLGRGLSPAEVVAEVETFLTAQDSLPSWQLDRTRRAVTSMVSAIAAWIAENSDTRVFLGSEVPMRATLPTERGDPNPVQLTGRVDWLSGRAEDGSVVVSDFKTSATKPTKAEVADHAQLGTYQLGVALGAFGGSRQPGGAEIVHVRTGTPKVIVQPPLDDEGRRTRETAVRTAAAAIAAASAIAKENKHCERCSVRSSCPLQAEGRQVTR